MLQITHYLKLANFAMKTLLSTYTTLLLEDLHQDSYMNHYELF